MIHVVATAGTATGANPFTFVMAVTFVASTVVLGPVGYLTNLFVNGPGGYRVSEFTRIDAALHLVLSTVTVLGIALIWGL